LTLLDEIRAGLARGARGVARTEAYPLRPTPIRSDCYAHVKGRVEKPESLLPDPAGCRELLKHRRGAARKPLENAQLGGDSGAFRPFAAKLRERRDT
jgi:hypothetical protein